MQELIYKQDAHDKLENMYLLIERDRGQGNEVAKGLRMACKAIGDIEAVDAEMPCSVRHGRLELGAKADNACVIPSDFEFYCTCCGKEAIRDYDDTQVLSDFCPHCGAEMDAEDDQSGGGENAVT